MGNSYITKVFHFCAAHQYGNSKWTDEENKNVFGPDVKIHGHNYSLEVMVTGDINPDTGFVVDLGYLKDVVQENVLSELDHSFFDRDIPWFKDRQPSSENLVQYIWGKIEPALKNVKLVRIRLRETPTIFTDYYGDNGP